MGIYLYKHNSKLLKRDMGLPVKIKQELKGTINTTSNKNEHHKTPITKINYNNLTNRSARSTIRLQENLRLKK